MNTKSSQPAGVPAVLRDYVAACDVAIAIGVHEKVLHDRRPDAWSVPRDMKWDGRRYLFALASLPQLGAELMRAGWPDQALLLQDYIVAETRRRLEAAAAAGDRPVPVAHVDATDEELERLNARDRRHASDREAVPTNWMREHEEAHDA